MALPKRPAGADIAAGTMGLSVTFWQDTESSRSRRPPVRRQSSSPRQQVVRVNNQIAFDEWDLLTDRERAAWADVARRERPKTIAGSWAMVPRLEYTRRMITLLHAGRPLRHDAPGVEVMPTIDDMQILRLNWSGGCTALWAPAFGPGDDGLIAFGVGRALNLSGPSPPTGRLEVLGYAAAAGGHFDFTILVRETRYVGWRPVSAYGKSHSSWRVSTLRGW